MRGIIALMTLGLFAVSAMGQDADWKVFLTTDVQPQKIEVPVKPVDVSVNKIEDTLKKIYDKNIQMKKEIARIRQSFTSVEKGDWNEFSTESLQPVQSPPSKQSITQAPSQAPVQKGIYSEYEGELFASHGGPLRRIFGFERRRARRAAGYGLFGRGGC